MNRANRIMWSVIGLILMAAGVIGALVNIGHFPGTDRHVAIITDGMTARWRTWDAWAPAAVGVAGLIVAIAGISLIRAESRRRRGHSLADVVLAPTPNGATAQGDPAARGLVQVSGRTLRHALQQDLQNNPRIKHAAVRLTGRTDQPRLHLDLDVAANTDLPAIHAYVADALDRFRTTSQLQPTLAETTIKIP